MNQTDPPIFMDDLRINPRGRFDENCGEDSFALFSLNCMGDGY